MTAKITSVERFTLQVPFVDRVRRAMERAGVHTWSELEITRVETDAGMVGWGETIQNYTWGRVHDHERVVGRPPAELMWDDSLGAGLQMALFDAAGKLAGVPVYRLLGPKCPRLVCHFVLGPRHVAGRIRRRGSDGCRARLHLHEDENTSMVSTCARLCAASAK